MRAKFLKHGLLGEEGMATSSDKHGEARKLIYRYCRNFSVDQVDWNNASDPTDGYNCMGYALRVLKWWQPAEWGPNKENLTPKHHWPRGVPENLLIESYVLAAKTEHFRECKKSEWVEGCEMIVLYYKEFGGNKEFTHAARCVSPDKYESKLGEDSDIPHPADAFDNIWFYGNGRVYMMRGTIGCWQRVKQFLFAPFRLLQWAVGRIIASLQSVCPLRKRSPRGHSFRADTASKLPQICWTRSATVL